MNYKESGEKSKRTIMLLHGGGLSWWNYREAAGLLGDEYHIILPVLDGHAGSDRHFTSIEDNAKEIISFINTHLNGSVYMIGGLSLGGQILLEMLSQQSSICQYALIESAMVLPSKLTNALLRPSVGCSYPLIRKKWFAELQFRQLRLKGELFDDYYRDTCLISKEDMISFLEANTSYSLKKTIRECKADVRIYYGEKETSGIIRSAKAINAMLPGSKLTSLPGMYHADLSINHPEAYAEAVRSIQE